MLPDLLTPVVYWRCQYTAVRSGPCWSWSPHPSKVMALPDLYCVVLHGTIWMGVPPLAMLGRISFLAMAMQVRGVCIQLFLGRLLAGVACL